MVATKSDMLPQAVSEEEGRSWAKKKGLLFFQVQSSPLKLRIAFRFFGA